MIRLIYQPATLAEFELALDLLARHPAATLASVQAPSATPRQAPSAKGSVYDGELVDGLPPSEYYKRERGEARFRTTQAERDAGLTGDAAALVRMQAPDWRTAKAGLASANESAPVVAASELDESDL